MYSVLKYYKNFIVAFIIDVLFFPLNSVKIRITIDIEMGPN